MEYSKINREGLGCGFSSCFLQEHDSVAEDKNERNKKWDKHTKTRPGGKEKKKDESRGWFKRNPPKKGSVPKEDKPTTGR